MRQSHTGVDFMSTECRIFCASVVPIRNALWLPLLAVLLSGCVTEVREPPPRRVVYMPPPPAVDVVIEVQAYEPPPPLPVYEQPLCPGDGFLWVPGYWHYAAAGGYYWIPGTWVMPPRVGVVWTPGYWGFVGGVYAFHAGYWGPHVGFYGGINYGHGYGGVGFAGGRWVGNSFAYNRSVTNVNVTVVHNTYNETVINNVTVNHVSYNGGTGGVAAAPSPEERLAVREAHVPPTPQQRDHMQQAARNPGLFARSNGGRPAIATTPGPAAAESPADRLPVTHAPIHSEAGRAETSGNQSPAAPHEQRVPEAMRHPEGSIGQMKEAAHRTPANEKATARKTAPNKPRPKTPPDGKRDSPEDHER
jgi:hypothetical protein